MVLEYVNLVELNVHAVIHVHVLVPPHLAFLAGLTMSLVTIDLMNDTTRAIFLVDIASSAERALVLNRV